jgi:hypothetical protein
MKNYFVKYGEFANVYTVASADKTNKEVIDLLLAEGYERITRKEAEALCRRERERRQWESNGGYASAEIGEAYINTDGMLVVR